MARYRSTSPIPGYSGHIPGEKWQVGSRIRYGHEDDPRVNHAVREPEHTDDTAISSDQSHTYDWDGNPVHITRKQSMSAGQDKKTASGDRMKNEMVNEMPRYQSVTSPKQAGSPSNANTPIPSVSGRRSQSHGRQSRQSAKTDHSEEILYEGFPKQILRRSNEGSVVSHSSRKSDVEGHAREHERDLKSVASIQLSEDAQSGVEIEELETPRESEHETHHSEGQHTRTITPESEHGTEYTEQNPSEGYPTQRSPEVNQSNYGNSERLPPPSSVISHPAAEKPEYQYVPQRFSIDKPPQGFDGLGLDEMQAGYWSEGQALKNIRAHQRSLRGLNAKNNSKPQHNWNNINEEEVVGNKHAHDDYAEEHQSHYTDNRQNSRQNGRFMRDTPVPGYSGHMTEIARLGVGKPFTEAAKESIKLQQSYQDILRGTFATTERTNTDLK